MRLLCRVPSLTTKGKSYAIRMFEDGPGCDCLAFEHSPPPDKTCKHLAIYEAALHAVTRCADAGHKTVSAGGFVEARWSDALQGLCRQCVVELLAAAAMKVRTHYVPAEKVVEVKAKAAAKVADIRERAKRRKAKR